MILALSESASKVLWLRDNPVYDCHTQPKGLTHDSKDLFSLCCMVFLLIGVWFLSPMQERTCFWDRSTGDDSFEARLHQELF